MQILKSLFVATVVFSSAAVPSFASDQFSLGGDENAAMSNEMSSSADEGYNADARRGRRDRDREWRRRRPVECFAQNGAGRTFVARGWNARNVQNTAVRTCRAYSFGPLRFTCRAIGCR